MDKRITAKEIKEKFGYSRTSLINWEQMGLIVPEYTPRGHRRYSENQIKNLNIKGNKMEELTQLNNIQNQFNWKYQDTHIESFKLVAEKIKEAKQIMCGLFGVEFVEVEDLQEGK